MRFVIADLSLTGYSGHYYHYDSEVSQQAKKRGMEVTVLGSAAVNPQIQADLAVIPCFRRGFEHSYARDGGLKDILKTQAEYDQSKFAEEMLEDLLGTGSQIDWSASDVIFFHTINQNQIIPIVQWAEILGTRCPKIALFFRFTSQVDYWNDEESVEATAYKTAFTRLRSSTQRERFVFFSDSAELITEYEALSQLPVHLLPIPHVYPPATEASDESGAKRPIRLTYLGNVRSSKGFHLIPFAVNRLQSRIESGEIEFELQANLMFQRDTPSVQALDVLKSTDVELLDKELDSTEYFDLLNRADIVMLPYSLSYYHVQSSGVFCEAVGSGKVVVVPRGTWMSRQMSMASGGTFYPEDSLHFYQVLADVLANYDELKTQAEAKADSWRAVHNPERFFDQLIATVGS